MNKSIKVFMSAILTSSVVFSSIVSADNVVTNELEGLKGRGIVTRQIKEINFRGVDDPNNWIEVPSGYHFKNDKEMRDYLAWEETQNKAAERVAKGPVRVVGEKVFWTGYELAKPFIFAGAARVAIDFGIGVAAPWMAERVGEAAKSASVSLLPNFLRGVPYVDEVVGGAAKTTAQGEFYYDIRPIVDTVRSYAYPVAKTVMTAGKAAIDAGQTTYTAAKSAVSKVSGWVSSAWSWATAKTA